MKPSERWAALVAQGCTCGDEPYTTCPLHKDPGDNRGIRAWSQAGMPGGFPMPDCTCSQCGQTGCLLYPNIEIDDPKRSGEFRRTLICPHCSTPGAEATLVADALAFGHRLNDLRVFGSQAAAA